MGSRLDGPGRVGNAVIEAAKERPPAAGPLPWSLLLREK